MYDDYTRGGWTVGDAEGALHLCPECRDLLYDVVALERRPVRPVLEPPSWIEALNWLDAHCGTRQAVLTLNDAPLAGPVPPVPDGLSPDEIARYAEVAEALDRAADRFFGGRDGEVGLALRRGLTLLAVRRSGLLTAERPTRCALGVIWAISKANGLLHPTTSLTERTVREFLGSDASANPVGTKVRTAIRSVYSWTDGDQPSWRWPSGTAEGRTPLGQPGLLTAQTRALLIEVRERAMQAMATEPWPPPAQESAA